MCISVIDNKNVSVYNNYENDFIKLLWDFSPIE